MKEAIKKAVAAHSMWKARLRTAIQSGKTDVPVATIKMDNQCEFGKWLHSSASTIEAKHMNRYKVVKDLHAQFHKMAGQVAELAVEGNRNDAEQLLDGEYASASVKLTKEMMDWQKDIG